MTTKAISLYKTKHQTYCSVVESHNKNLSFVQIENLPINSHGRCTCWAFSLPRSSRRCSRLFRVPRRSSQKLGAQTYLVTAKVAKIQLGWTLGDQGKIGKTKNGTRFLGMFWSKYNDNGNRRLIHQAVFIHTNEVRLRRLSKQRNPGGFFRRFSRPARCAFSLRRLRQGSLAWVIDSVTRLGHKGANDQRKVSKDGTRKASNNQGSVQC